MTELTRRKAMTAALAALTLPVTVPARAQAWPTKPIKIIVSVPAGGGVALVLPTGSDRR